MHQSRSDVGAVHLRTCILLRSQLGCCFSLLLQHCLPLLLRNSSLLFFMSLLCSLESRLARQVRCYRRLAAKHAGILWGGGFFYCRGRRLDDSLGGMARVLFNLPKQSVGLVVSFFHDHVIDPGFFVPVIVASANENAG